MSILNKETGMYEATKMLKTFGQEVIGMGSTKQEALLDLKQKLSRFEKIQTKMGQFMYLPPLAETGNRYRSPGFYSYKTDGGKVRYGFIEDHHRETVARPSLADAIKNNKMPQRQPRGPNKA